MNALSPAIAPASSRRMWRRDRSFHRGSRFLTAVATVLLWTSGLLLTLVLPLAPPLSSVLLRAQTAPFFHTAVVEDIGPGVQHISLLAAHDDGHQAIHVVRVQRGDPAVALTAALARDRVAGTESVLNQARRLHEPGRAVIAAVNADFFASSPVAGQPIGIHLEAGEIIVSPNGRPVFGIDKNGVPVIGTATLQGEVWRDRAFDDDLFARAAIHEVNRPLTRLETVLYTPRLGADTPPTNGTLVTLRNIAGSGSLQPGVVYTGVVVEGDVVRGAGGMRARIPDDGVVLAARGPAQVLLDDLVPGETVHFRLGLSAPFHELTNAVAGWPILLSGGEKAELNSGDSLVTARHPRTAVGFNEREIFLVTVDGRQPGYADGMDLHELTDFMLSLGATDALNLDGGGSTTMLVRPPGRFEPVVVNRPSDGHERAVANSLFVTSSAAPEPLARLIPLPAVHLQQADDGATPGAVGAVGGVDEVGGVGAVVASSNPTASSSVAGTPDDPSGAVHVLVGSRLPLTVFGQDARHGPVQVDASQVVWSVDGPTGHVATHVAPGQRPGRGPTDEPGDRPADEPGDAAISSQNATVFTARRPGAGTVRARAGGAAGQLAIRVVESVDALRIRPDIVHVSAGETLPLAVQGYDAAGRPVWLNPDQLQWSVLAPEPPTDPDGTTSGASSLEGGDKTDVAAASVFAAGDAMHLAQADATSTFPVSIDASGRITGLWAGEAVVQGRVGDVTATVRVVVDRAPIAVATFDATDTWFANAARSRATLSFGPPPRPLPRASGTSRSVVQLEYDFTAADGATAAAYVQAVEPIPLPDRPTALGVWVHADNNEHWLRANVFDGEGNRHVVDFTPVGGITWKGWRWVTAELPSDIPLPIAFERIYVAEIHRHRQTAGVLYFDQLQALYTTPQLACGPEGSRTAAC